MQIESAARLAEFCSERCCRIRRCRQLLLYDSRPLSSSSALSRCMDHMREKSLEDGKRSEDVSILARELNSVA